MVSAVGWAALAPQESLKIRGFPAISVFGRWGGGAQAAPDSFENTTISMHLHGFGGGPGGPRIIENLRIYMHFHCVGNGMGGGAGGPLIENKGFPNICIVSEVGWAALAPQE